MNKRQVAWGCMQALLKLVALYLFYYFLVGRALPPPFGVVLSVLGTAFALWVIIEVRTAKSRSEDLRLMRSALDSRQNTLLVNGERAAFFGQIASISGKVIVSPVTQQSCVFYTYSIYHWEYSSRGGSQSRDKRNEYAGIHLIPCAVNSKFGEIRLFGLPTLVGVSEETIYSHQEDRSSLQKLDNMRAYLQNTPFVSFQDISLSRMGDTYDRFKNMLVAGDGYIRHDARAGDDEFDLKSVVSESCILAGEDVCMIGAWSEKKRGVVCKDGEIVIVKGRPEPALKAMKKSRAAHLETAIIVFCTIHTLVGAFWWMVHMESAL